MRCVSTMVLIWVEHYCCCGVGNFIETCKLGIMKPLLTTLALLVAHVLSAQVLVNTDFEKGYLKDGKRFGVWEFYTDDKDLELKIDLTTGKIYYLKPSTFEYFIQQGDSWISSGPAIYPIYALGTKNFYNELAKRISFPGMAAAYSESGRAAVIFTVDSLGQAKDFELIDKFGYGSDHQIIEAMKGIPNLWIPAIVNQRKKNARFILPIMFLTGKSNIREKTYSQAATILPPLRVEPPIATKVDVPIKRAPVIVFEEEKEFYEQFDVIENTNVKNGDYIKYKKFGSGFRLIEKGSYKNDQRQGSWQEFFITDEIRFARAMNNKVKRAGTYVDGFKDGLWEDYYLDNDPTNISFKKTSHQDTTAFTIKQDKIRVKSRGQYSKGKKVGVWVDYTFSGDTSRLFDYDSKVLLRDAEIASLNSYHNKPYALYHGGSKALSLDFILNFDLSVAPYISRDSIPATFQVIVSPTGRTLSAKKMKGNLHTVVTSKIIETIKKCNDWIPAYKNSVPVESSVLYHVTVLRDRMDEKNYSRAYYRIRFALASP